MVTFYSEAFNLCSLIQLSGLPTELISYMKSAPFSLNTTTTVYALNWLELQILVVGKKGRLKAGD